MAEKSPPVDPSKWGQPPDDVTPLGEWYENYEPPPPKDEDFRTFVDKLEKNLEDDIGFSSKDETIDALARMYISDQPNYVRAEQILRRYKVLASVKMQVRQVAKGMRDLEKNIEGAAPRDELQSVLGVIKDAPCGPEIRMPSFWIMKDYSADGGYCLLKKITRKREGYSVEETVGVSYEPIIIKTRMIDIVNNIVNFEVAWKDHKGWHDHIVLRSALKGTREIIGALADYGFPIDMNSAKETITFLTDFEGINKQFITKKKVTTQMGWQGKNAVLGFMAGSKHIPGKGSPKVHFWGVDDGEKQMLRSVGERGTFGGWRDAISPLRAHKLVEASIYTSLAAALLRPLQAPNFVVDYCYKTSSGKTTTLAVAASVWGCPDINDQNSLISSWDMTAVGFERRASTLSCLPLLVDDTKRARSFRGDSIVPTTIYEITNGMGRSRGSLKGTAKTSYWKTIMITTGEQRVVDFDKSGGTAARVVTLWGNPFGINNEKTSYLIRKMRLALLENYGHAGPAFVKWLIDHKADWPEWKKHHHETSEGIRDIMLAQASEPSDISVFDRISVNLATIEMAAELAHQAMDFPWKYESPIAPMLHLAIGGITMADREVEALKHVISVAMANRNKFLAGENTKDEPNSGWMGYWDPHYRWDYIAFYQHALEKLLRDEGYEPRSTFNRWLESGWLKVDKDKKRFATKIYKVDGAPRMVTIKRDAIVKITGMDDIEDPSEQELTF